MRVMLGILVATVLVYAGVSRSRSPEPVVTAVFDGCLRTGSASSVFILRSAREAGAEAGARDYLLVAIASGTDLNAAMNHQVSIDGDASGAGEGPEPPAAANSAEKALRRLSVRGVKDSGQRC